MVFERKLRQPVGNWNVTHDKFIFQEKIDDPSIYVLKLWKDRTPKLFRFDFPDFAVKKRINTKWSEKNQRFEIPKEDEQDDNPFDIEDTTDKILIALEKEGYKYGDKWILAKVPNIVDISYGRGVGYTFTEHDLGNETHNISATKIRAQMRKEGKLARY